MNVKMARVIMAMLLAALLVCGPALADGTSLWSLGSASDDNAAEDTGSGSSFFSGAGNAVESDVGDDVEEKPRELAVMPYEPLPGDDFWYDEEYARLDEYMGSELNLVLPREISGTQLTMIGGIRALPEDIAINGGVLTAVVRGLTLQTWYREGDFVIASSMMFDEDNNLLPTQYYVAESPRASYPMSTVVKFKRDVEATTALVGGQKLTFREGETAILTATDDNSYVYAVPADISAHDWLPGGYLMLGEDFGSVIVDGEAVFAGDVMDGLIYAD